MTAENDDIRIDDDLARYRDEYPILADTLYLNSNSMGAMHHSAPRALAEYARVWAQEGVEAWDQWPAIIEETADMAAQFFNGLPGCTTLNQNVAFFQAAVASSLDFSGPRNKVVIEELMFPNVLYVWERFQSVGARLVTVPSDDGMTVSLERMLETIDHETAIVSISHAIYVSGALFDLKAIADRCREVGALLMVDVYQTAGIVPFDAQALGLDIVVGGSHKWLCGGPGTAFMYVRPEVREQLNPRTTGWMGHESPFEFAPPPIRYGSGGWRFMGGTPSMPAYYVAREAYRNLLEIGVDRIRRHNMALSRIIVERAQAAGLTVHSPLDETTRTGFVAVDFPDSDKASKRLIEDRVKHDWRPNCGLRLGPHFYTTQQEVEAAMEKIVALARGA